MKKNPYLADPYRVPNASCATCGKPSSSKNRKERYGSAGHGDWHYSCRRDSQGRLLVWDDILKRERPA